MTTSNEEIKFCGKYQPAKSRIPEIPAVNYNKGGSDFRTAKFSSFGKQISSTTKLETAPRAIFSKSDRFHIPHGAQYPKYIGQDSTIKRQALSTRKTATGTNFGTSTRAGALKLYAVYTAEKR